jgi:ribonuclease-3 family protein
MISELKARNMSPLSLAFIGDAAQMLYVKAKLISEQPDLKAGKLHKQTAAEVNAKKQAVKAGMVVEKLTPDELSVFKRARNVSPKNVPSSAEISEYCMATAYEAVLGYLYMTGQNERLEELINVS